MSTIAGNRCDGRPVSAGRRSRASGTFVPKLELWNEGKLGNEGLQLVKFAESKFAKSVEFRSLGVKVVQA